MTPLCCLDSNECFEHGLHVHGGKSTPPGSRHNKQVSWLTQPGTGTRPSPSDSTTPPAPADTSAPADKVNPPRCHRLAAHLLALLGARLPVLLLGPALPGTLRCLDGLLLLLLQQLGSRLLSFLLGLGPSPGGLWGACRAAAGWGRGQYVLPGMQGSLAHLQQSQGSGGCPGAAKTPGVAWCVLFWQCQPDTIAGRLTCGIRDAGSTMARSAWCSVGLTFPALVQGRPTLSSHGAGMTRLLCEGERGSRTCLDTTSEVSAALLMDQMLPHSGLCGCPRGGATPVRAAQGFSCILELIRLPPRPWVNSSSSNRACWRYDICGPPLQSSATAERQRSLAPCPV